MVVRTFISLAILVSMLFPQGLIFLAIITLLIDLLRYWFNKTNTKNRNLVRFTFVALLLFTAEVFKRGSIFKKKQGPKVKSNYPSVRNTRSK
ncbi:hypothetical protein ACQR3P_28740 [Rhodococcus sp. IEGM1300]